MGIIYICIDIAQELDSVIYSDLNGKEIQKRQDICIHLADSLCCTVKIDIAVQSNQTPI